MKEIILFLSIPIVYVFVTTWGLRRKYNIAYREGVRFQHVNITHKVLEYTILIVIVLGIILTGGVYVLEWMLCYLLILYSIRSFMEWKYEKDQKKYVLSLNILIAFLLFTFFSIITILI
ncbi:DUF4181 domain-containing protein [Virgibacillus sp. SK37]|uniref:DUF4181 domain-containing protein n=1 Tax=Virgibacillus sp. SK37 TaxID=403957 RepID=UPI0004D1B108|nr:DUF4181 domain-containing protein [Virgibacillus sp. SK37]AIF45340.1 hypothetical protein X953_07410 [Virgibacillus sp. SK37]